MAKHLLELRCAALDNDWGKTGRHSLVAKLKESADDHFRLDTTSHYAQLWMGAEPAELVSVLLDTGHLPLQDWLTQHPEQLGEQVRDAFGGKLPFLLKVLSIQSVLALQAHPNKVLAEALHRCQPDVYLDDNHKPEMALALSHFVALCGFRPLHELAEYVRLIPELRAVLKESGPRLLQQTRDTSRSINSHCQQSMMRECFAELMQADADLMMSQLSALERRILDLKQSGADVSDVEGDVFLQLYQQFPGDPGCFCLYYLNLIRLQPGEAVFINATVPHAYISGDCVECMAISDNIVRGAFSHKGKDVRTLVDMLDYSAHLAANPKLRGLDMTEQDVVVTRFSTPIPDFGVTRYEVPSHVTTFDLDAVPSASICILIQGQGSVACARGDATTLTLRAGSTFFLAADTAASVCCERTGALLFRAHARLD